MYLKQRHYSWIDSIRIPFQCSPLATLMHIAVVLTTYFAPTIQIFATSIFIDRALNILNKKAAWQVLFLPILLLSGLIVYSRISGVLTNISKQWIGNGLRAHYVVAITAKRARLNYADVENHEVLDLIQRVSDRPDEAIQKGFTSVLNLLGIGVQVAGFLSVLFAHVWWAAFVVIIVAVPTVLVGTKGGEEQYEAQRQVAKYKRRHEYIDDVLTSRESVNERSLFGYSDKLKAQWLEFYQKARGMELKVSIKWIVRMKAISSAMSLITLAVAAVLIPPVSAGTLTVGLFIALVQASNSVVDLMSWDLSDSINDFAKQKEYLKDVEKFSNMPETAGATDLPVSPPPVLRYIEFRNVTFRYPGTEHDVLSNLNLRLIAGCHYAIVGRNGAGKTTLLKLLTGLYTEFDGDILINGQSIRKYSIPELKALTTVLFQDFAQYYVSLHDNIALGDITHLHTPDQDERILKAAEKLGLSETLNALPQGIQTPLGKLNEEGLDLSGGQWQRVAIARTAVSHAPLRILDEPTASLDPISESKLYENFDQISRGFTTLLISHRLGSVKIADEILVLDKGKIIQQGTHAELMKQNGLYRDMYESQRSWYQ